MGGPWAKRGGKPVHPNAPAKRGGPGRFKDQHPLGSHSNTRATVPHPHSPAARHLTPDDKQQQKIADESQAQTSQSDVEVNAKVKAEAEGFVGKPVVGSGECYDLADKVLQEAGSKSAPAYGTVTGDGDYKWGTPISDVTTVKPGDVLQFRDHVIEIVKVRKLKKTTSSGTRSSETIETKETHKRGHHTAIVLSNDGRDLVVAEQHVLEPGTDHLSKVVRRNTFPLTSSTRKLPPRVTTDGGGTKIEEETTVTTTVKGKIWAYRPQEQKARK